MRRRTLLQASLGHLGALAMLMPNAFGGQPATRSPLASMVGMQWHQRHLLGFGTALAIRVAHRDGALAEQALDAVVATVRHVEAQMSLFNPDSALCRLNRDGVLHDPHPDLLEVLSFSQRVSERSCGAFDVTVQPLWEVFETAQRASKLPSRQAVMQARARVDWKALKLSPRRIGFNKSGMSVTLNGIAQGFAADLVRRKLQVLGVEHALINTGEWAALGQPDNHRGWTLGISNPRDESQMLARLLMDGRSIATSADNQATFSSDFRNHHIFDPRTGFSPPEVSSVTVAAASCAMADALTKVMFVAGPRRALKLAAHWHADILLVDKAGRWVASPGLQLLRT